jgi:hypothetical protein
MGSPWAEKKVVGREFVLGFQKVDSMWQAFVDNKKGMKHQIGGESNLVKFH